MNRPNLRGKAFFRLVFFSPSLVGVVFVAMMFSVMFGEKEGLVNTLLRAVIPGFPPVFAWLQHYVMSALIIASLWMYVGFNMIYFLAALQSVGQDGLEAAEIDGASAWQRFATLFSPKSNRWRALSCFFPSSAACNFSNCLSSCSEAPVPSAAG